MYIYTGVRRDRPLHVPISQLTENVTQYQTETGSSAWRRNLHTAENYSELFSAF